MYNIFRIKKIIYTFCKTADNSSDLSNDKDSRAAIIQYNFYINSLTT